MSSVFSFLVSSRPSRGASRALFVIVMVARSEGLAVLLVSVSSGRGGVSFACPAAWRRACPHPSPIVSFCFSSFRLVGRLVSRLVLRCPASRGRGVLARLIVIILLVGRGSWCRDCSFRLSSRRVGRHVRLVVASRLLVSGSGEALVSRFIPTVSGGAAVLVLLSRGRCLLALMPSGR